MAHVWGWKGHIFMVRPELCCHRGRRNEGRLVQWLPVVPLIYRRRPAQRRHRGSPVFPAIPVQVIWPYRPLLHLWQWRVVRILKWEVSRYAHWLRGISKEDQTICRVIIGYYGHMHEAC